MIERRSRVCFLIETAETIAVLGEPFREHFDGDLSTQARVFSQIHFAHSALANLRADFIAAEFCAGAKSHYSIVTRLAQLKS